MKDPDTLTFFPQGAYMIMLFDSTHDRVKTIKRTGNLVEAYDEAEAQLQDNPELYSSYAVARILKNSLADKWSTKTYE